MGYPETPKDVKSGQTKLLDLTLLGTEPPAEEQGESRWSALCMNESLDQNLESTKVTFRR